MAEIGSVIPAPRTNAEVEMMCQLSRVAQLGQLYHDLLFYCDNDIEYEFLNRGEDVPESVQKTLQRIRDLRKKALRFVEEEFMNRIEEYNEARAKVKSDKRPRNQILAEERAGRE